MNDNLTPTVDQQSTMSFPDAMRAVIDGKRVARIAWGNADYCLLKDGWLTVFHKKTGEELPRFHSWLVNDGDMEGTDWIILPDIN